MTSFGRKKTNSNCLANLPRTISQTSSLFRQRQHKRKIRDKNKRYCRQNKCSDLTCTKKYALTEGPKREGELMWATRSAPPVILCLLRACSEKDVKGITFLERKTVVLGRINLRSGKVADQGTHST